MDEPQNNRPQESESAEVPRIELPVAQPSEAAALPKWAGPLDFSRFPEDLRGPWTSMDLLLFIGFALGMQVLLDYLLINIFILLEIVPPVPSAIQAFATSSAVYVTLKQLLWSLGMLIFLYYLLHPRTREGFWSVLGWRAIPVTGVPRAAKYWMYALAGVPLAIAIQLLSKFVQPEQPVPMEVFFRDKDSVLLLTTMGVLVAPVVEETLFRGFLYPVLARRWGPAGAVALTGILFGFMHAPQLWGAWFQIGLLMLVGMSFTAVRAHTKSVVPCYFLHLGYNAFLFLGFYVYTQGLQNLPQH